jgi:glycosyltransferase involved in cell wall biosynthesis
MPALYNGLDLACSSSAFGEGFSNALAEAMACGVPCVATPTGDAAILLGTAGTVVDSYRPEDFAGACASLLDRLPRDRAALSKAARARIVEHFTIRKLVQTTEDALSQLVS